MIPNSQALMQQAVADGVTHFATGVAIFRDGKLLVVRRVANDFLGGLWELPGGSVDEGESWTAGAIREAFEETGLHVIDIIAQFAGFDYQTPTKPKVRQINYLVAVEMGDIQLEPSEHDAYRWITSLEIADLQTSDEMKACLRAAFQTFAN